MSLRLVRSPVAPNITITHGSAGRPCDSAVGFTGVTPFSFARGPLDVAAELEAHGREYLGGEVVLTTRRETLVERRAEHGRGDALFNCGADCPTSFAGVRHTA